MRYCLRGPLQPPKGEEVICMIRPLPFPLREGELAQSNPFFPFAKSLAPPSLLGKPSVVTPGLPFAGSTGCSWIHESLKKANQIFEFTPLNFCSLTVSFIRRMPPPVFVGNWQFNLKVCRDPDFIYFSKTISQVIRVLSLGDENLLVVSFCNINEH